MTVNDLTPAEILDRLQENDVAFIGELQVMIRKIAHRWNWSGSASLDDISQDCFVKILESLRAEKFAGHSSFATWVYAIVRNTCLDEFRADKIADHLNLDEVELISPRESPEEILISRQQRRTAWRVLRSLPKSCRKIWKAVFFDHLKYKEIGQLMGLSEGSIKRKMWECRQMAREMAKSYE